MDFSYFVEGPLLKAVLALFVLGISIRTTLFVVSILRSRDPGRSGRGRQITLLVRFFLPYHRVALKKPLYTLLRYLFHVPLFMVPLWLAEHIVLWEDSRFEWSWPPLPAAWADLLTLTVLLLAAWFLIRRIVVRQIRTASTLSDYLLILIAALPFLSGYLVTHGTLSEISFFDNHLYTIHVLSGEALLLTTVLLFARLRLDPDRCIGCAACELSCPTATLSTRDRHTVREFKYAHYRCICCGACAGTCPEAAAALKHSIGGSYIFQFFTRQIIGKAALAACDKCGTQYLPAAQIDKVHQLVGDDSPCLCPSCKAEATARQVYRFSPRSLKLPVAGQALPASELQAGTTV